MSISIGTRVAGVGVYKNFGGRRRGSVSQGLEYGTSLGMLLVQILVWMFLGTICLELALVIAVYGSLAALVLFAFPRTRSAAKVVFTRSMAQAKTVVTYPSRVTR